MVHRSRRGEVRQRNERVVADRMRVAGRTAWRRRSCQLVEEEVEREPKSCRKIGVVGQMQEEELRGLGRGMIAEEEKRLREEEEETGELAG